MAFAFEKLLVYQKSVDFADEVCSQTENFSRGYGFLVANSTALLFHGHTFHIKNPLRHEWFKPEIEHDVPAGGILFIRPICNPERDRRWQPFPETVAPWNWK